MGILQKTIGQETASQAALRNCSNEEPEYIGPFAGKKHIVRYQKITYSSKSLTSAVNYLVFFHVWEDVSVCTH